MKKYFIIYLALVCCTTAKAQGHFKNMPRVNNHKQMSYDEFVRASDSTYIAFRDSINREYAEFMRKPWRSEPIEEPVVKPKDEEKPPVVYTPPSPKPTPTPETVPTPKPKQDSIPPVKSPVLVAPLDTPEIEVPVIVLPTPKPIEEQPEPVVTIPENDLAEGYHKFTFLGTEMKARWSDADKFKLEGDNENAFANAYLDLTKSKYNNLYNDALKLREDYKLCDWAFYLMTQALAETACGKGTEEAVFLQGVMLIQTGYKLRFCYDQSHKLHLMVKSANHIYDHMYYNMNGEHLYILDKYEGTKVNICDKAFPGESSLSLDVKTLPLLSENRSNPRTIKSARYNVVTTTTTNKNLLPFFSSYPTSYSEDNIMTRWAYYANTPLEAQTRDSLYTQLKMQMTNADQRLQANMLLNWIQTGFQYELDDKVWGHDRAFFPDETLYYPYCDCEDRAILLTRLVRDLMGLDCLLVYYPKHLAAAIGFTEEVNGDYIMINGKKYTIADPTYINAPVGRTMSEMDNSTAKVIVLNK